MIRRGNDEQKWVATKTLPSKSYVCGHCGEYINSNSGYFLYSDNGTVTHYHGYIYICHYCLCPTFFDSNNTQVPGEVFGKKFDDKIFDDESIKQLYNEARLCYSVNAFSSVSMCCRKILMHIAVNCGAKENESFVYYVDYLDENNYIPEKAKSWVSKIRNKGNDVNHKIILSDEKESKILLTFIEVLITMIYEMPYKASLFDEVK